MKHNSLKVITLSTLAFLTLFSGIIRHDVDEKEYLKLAAEKQFDCVGQVFKDTSAGGSCVLISDRFVLSAAHVFIESDSRPDTMEVNGQTLISYNAYNERATDADKITMVFNGQKVKAKRIIMHPQYLDSLTKGSCDIAIIELEHPLTAISPAKLNNAFDELKSTVVGVGYGASGPANRPDLVDVLNKKIAGENVIDSIGGYECNGLKTLLFADFDHPTDTSCCNRMGSPIPKPLEFMTAGGDSGGGLFRYNKNEWELIGITSGGGIELEQFMKSFYYGQIDSWTRVSALHEWIIENIK